MTALEAKAHQELRMAQVMASEILARACFFAHSILGPTCSMSPRSRAHAILAEVLDEVELANAQCEGRA
jgi:hypothetical protein